MTSKFSPAEMSDQYGVPALAGVATICNQTKSF